MIKNLQIPAIMSPNSNRSFQYITYNIFSNNFLHGERHHAMLASKVISDAMHVNHYVLFNINFDHFKQNDKNNFYSNFDIYGINYLIDQYNISSNRNHILISPQDLVNNIMKTESIIARQRANDAYARTVYNGSSISIMNILQNTIVPAAINSMISTSIDGLRSFKWLYEKIKNTPHSCLFLDLKQYNESMPGICKSKIFRNSIIPIFIKYDSFGIELTHFIAYLLEHMKRSNRTCDSNMVLFELINNFFHPQSFSKNDNNKDIMIGCDPEFSLHPIVSQNNKKIVDFSKFLHASDYFTGRRIGIDGCSDIAEIRPKASSSPEKIVDDIETIFKQMHKIIKKRGDNVALVSGGGALRATGGHLHFGSNMLRKNLDSFMLSQLGELLDTFLYNPIKNRLSGAIRTWKNHSAIVNVQNTEKIVEIIKNPATKMGNCRFSDYESPSAFRRNAHGIEYRSLPSFFLDKKFSYLVFKIAHEIVKYYHQTAEVGGIITFHKPPTKTDYLKFLTEQEVKDFFTYLRSNAGKLVDNIFDNWHIDSNKIYYDIRIFNMTILPAEEIGLLDATRNVRHYLQTVPQKIQKNIEINLGICGFNTENIIVINDKVMVFDCNIINISPENTINFSVHDICRLWRSHIDNQQQRNAMLLAEKKSKLIVYIFPMNINHFNPFYGCHRIITRKIASIIQFITKYQSKNEIINEIENDMFGKIKYKIVPLIDVNKILTNASTYIKSMNDSIYDPPTKSVNLYELIQ